MYDVLYYAYVLVFGVFVSLRLSCGAFTPQLRRMFPVLCPLLLLLQGGCLLIWDMNIVRLLYPLITHLPIALLMTLKMRVKWETALVSVVLSYSLCQLPRWVGLLIAEIGMGNSAGSMILHIALSQLILVLLAKYCLDAIHDVIIGLRHALVSFGALPILYYLYEYFMIYTDRRYADRMVFDELLPTGLVLFFVIFAVAWQREMEKRRRAELQAEALEMRMDSAEHEIAALRMVQDQTAVYRHDMRHHLLMILSYLGAGRHDQAEDYIHRVNDEISAIAPVRRCENETVNLLLGAYCAKAERLGVKMHIEASLPEETPLADNHLCAMLSNGMENALNAAEKTDGGWVKIYCAVRQDKLLIEIKNPYAGKLEIRDGLPETEDGRSHLGCRSIRAIVEKQRGMCAFGAEKGIFTLRIAIPLVI